jgi:Na+-transporting methylmalonyl-CoA/oxaloacetate decarboxylase gamma subunit
VLKVLLVLIILAIATYALVRVVQRRGVTTPPLAGTRRAHRPSGPLGPDDDDEFLRDLDRKRLDGEGPDNGP